MNIGPFNPSIVNPVDDGNLTLKLRSLDIDDVTEYFNIYDEDGTFIGKTPVGAGQCANAEFSIIIPKVIWQSGFRMVIFNFDLSPISLKAILSYPLTVFAPEVPSKQALFLK